MEAYRKKGNFQLAYFDQPHKCFLFLGGRRRGVALCINAACPFQFSCLLSCEIITHPLLLLLGLRQRFPCHCQPTRWIKSKANPRLLLSFFTLLISLALILKQPFSLLNEPLQVDEPRLYLEICILSIKATWRISDHSCHLVLTDPLTLKCQFVLHFCLNLEFKHPTELVTHKHAWMIDCFRSLRCKRPVHLSCAYTSNTS